MLTPRQQQCLQFIRAYQQAHKGVSPSFDEICRELGLRSRAGAHRLLKGLEVRGKIRRLPHLARAIEVVEPVVQPDALARVQVFVFDDVSKELKPWAPPRTERSA